MALGTAVRIASFAGLCAGVGVGVHQFFTGRFVVADDQLALVFREAEPKRWVYGPGRYHCIPLLGERPAFVSSAPRALTLRQPVTARDGSRVELAIEAQYVPSKYALVDLVRGNGERALTSAFMDDVATATIRRAVRLAAEAQLASAGAARDARVMAGIGQAAKASLGSNKTGSTAACFAQSLEVRPVAPVV